MSIKKVLLTGATGRTGSLVLKKLRQRTAEFAPIGFARSQSKAKELFGESSGFVFGDILDKTGVKQAMIRMWSINHSHQCGAQNERHSYPRKPTRIRF